jgi:hypothetical protein
MRRSGTADGFTSRLRARDMRREWREPGWSGRPLSVGQVLPGRIWRRNGRVLARVSPVSAVPFGPAPLNSMTAGSSISAPRNVREAGGSRPVDSGAHPPPRRGARQLLPPVCARRPAAGPTEAAARHLSDAHEHQPSSWGCHRPGAVRHRRTAVSSTLCPASHERTRQSVRNLRRWTRPDGAAGRGARQGPEDKPDLRFFERAARVAATAPIDRQYGAATSDSSVSRTRRNVLPDFAFVIMHS